MCLLFTSQPNADKVADYDELVAPVAPAGNADEQGDVRLSYISDRDESGGAVEKHSVRV